jgi:hypothetical protein
MRKAFFIQSALWLGWAYNLSAQVRLKTSDLGFRKNISGFFGLSIKKTLWAILMALTNRYIFIATINFSKLN